MQRRNFRFLGLALVGAMTFGAAACGDTVTIPPPAPSLTVTPATLNLQVGQTAQIVPQAQNLPQGTTAQYTYTSTNPAAATVTAAGVVQAVGAGTTTIVVGVQGQQGLQAAVQVNVTAPTQPQRTVMLTPTQATVNVGQSVTLVSTVTGTTQTAVTFRSATPAIATVNAQGVVTGVAPGTAVITALLQQDTTVRATSTITVLPAAQPGGNAAINIGTITQGPGGAPGSSPIGQPVTPGAVSGQIDITLNVTPGTSDSLRVFVGNVEATTCRRNFAGTTNQNVPITCSINTAQLNAQGQPLFPNAVYTVRAVLFDNNQIAAEITAPQQLTFANVDQLALTITTVGVATTAGQAVGNDGLLWREGNVVVTATPAVFTQPVGTTIAAPQVCLNTGATGTPANVTICRTATAVAGSNTFTVTFPKSAAETNNVAGITTDNLTATVAGATTTTGQAFPGGMSASIRLDNVAPTAGTFVPSGTISTTNFINADFQFTNANLFATAPADVMPGSGIASTRFFVLTQAEAGAISGFGTPTAASLATFETTGREVTTGSQLAALASATPNLRVLAVTRDRVGNVQRDLLTYSLAIDVTAPTIASVTGTADRSVNQAITITAPVSDDFAGVTATPIEVRVIRRIGTTTQCINPNTGAATAFSAAFTMADCWTFVGTTFLVPTTACQGYYTVEFCAVDRAGNMTAIQTRTFLIDTSAPTVNMTSLALGAGSVTLGATITDNVDLMSSDVRFQFGATVFPFSAQNMFGSFGIESRITSRAETATNPLIRSLRMVDPTTGSVTTGATVTNVTGAGFGAFDVAGNFGQNFFAISPDAITGSPVGTIPTGMSAFSTSLTPSTICIVAATGCPTATTFSAVAFGGATFAQPFTQVNFYVQPFGMGPWILLGTSSTPVIQTAVDQRTYSYNFTISGLPAGTHPVVAVGVTGTRDAIMSGQQALTVNP